MNQAQERMLSLLSYAPPRSGGDSENSARSAWKEKDWEAAANEARRHGLGPLLFYRMKLRQPGITIPPRIAGVLRNEYLLNAASNMRRIRALTPSLEALQAAGVPTIVLKGAYLAEAVYGNPALRTMVDVDLLVHREDLKSADAALAGAGFSALEFPVSPPEDENEFHYRNGTGTAMIEVHWEMTKPEYPFRLDVDLLWKQAIPTRIAGVDVLALSPEDLILHIGLHAAIHRFAHGLRPLCDLAEALSRLSVNWDILWIRARNAGIGRSVRLLLTLAVDLLGMTIPAHALEGIDSSPLPAEIREEATETVFLGKPKQSGAAMPHPNLVLFVGRKRWRDKFALAARRIFPTRQSIAARYAVRADSQRAFLYYPASFWVLFKRNAPALRALFFGNKQNPLIDKKAAALMDWVLTRE